MTDEQKGQQGQRRQTDVLKQIKIVSVDLPERGRPVVRGEIDIMVFSTDKDKFNPKTMKPGATITGFVGIGYGQTSGKPFLKMTGPRLKTETAGTASQAEPESDDGLG